VYLDWNDKADRTFVIDIEADSLKPTQIWVMCWRNLGTNEKGACIGHDKIKEWFAERDAKDVFVGHNLLKFDAPVLNRLVGTDLNSGNCIDTLVLSTLYSPSISGGHSLDAWGERMGHPKIKFDEWDRLSDEMVEYCHMDVYITAKLFVRLMKTLAKIKFDERSVWIQHRMTEIIEQQRKNGFHFDGPRALALYQELRQIEKDLQSEIREAFPAERVHVAKRNMYTAAGKPTAIYQRDVERYDIEPSDDGTYDAYEFVEFNLGSPNQRIDKLVSLGWEPREFTPKTKKGGGGNPKPFDKGKLSPSLEEFLETHNVPEVRLIATWMSVNGRANMINTWLEAWNENDSKIHGKLFVADTLRFRHQAPNTANIPAVRVGSEGRPLLGKDGYFTYESRDLWTARPNRFLVGTDAAGLELRMLAHYLNRPDFTKQVVEGDPHQYNADVVGITRPEAKTLIYSILYGAGPPKIAKTLGLPVFTRKDKRGNEYEVSPEGEKVRQLFLDRLGIGEIIEQAENEQRSGRIELVDGSQVICPSPHAALNYKLQGGGARVMALGACILDSYIRKLQFDSLKVGDIHDEWQHDVHPDYVYDHAAVAEEAIREAGRKLNMNVPLDAESKIGLTWAETH